MEKHLGSVKRYKQLYTTPKEILDLKVKEVIEPGRILMPETGCTDFLCTIPKLHGQRRRHMHTVKVKKDELLAALRENRKNHREIFEDALKGYRAAVIEELEKRLKMATSGKKIDIYIKLIEPQDQTKDYDRAIKMLEMSVDTEITLDEQQFAQYVQDDWHWKEQFLISNSAYTNMLRED